MVSFVKKNRFQVRIFDQFHTHFWYGISKIRLGPLWFLIRNHPTLGQGLTLKEWCLLWLVPLRQATGTRTTCPSGTGRLGQAVLAPVGQAQLVPTVTGKGQKWPLLVPWDKSYTHAVGLSLSRDKLYTHDGACTSSTCPNMSHKEGLQGREILPRSPMQGWGRGGCIALQVLWV